MRAREKRVIAVASAVTIVALIVVAAMVITPSGVLTFSGRSSVRAGNAEEGMILEVEVGGWVPIGPLPKILAWLSRIVGDSFWIINGTKYTTVSATLKVKLTYYGIKVGSLNATIIRVWCEYSGKESYIIKADPINSINTETSGTYDRYSSNPFTGSKSVDTIANELSLQKSSGNTYTVHYYYQVRFEGIGEKSGDLIPADTGEKSPENRASDSWQWYIESADSPTTSVEVNYSSWVDFGFGAVLGALLAYTVYTVVARRRRW